MCLFVVVAACDTPQPIESLIAEAGELDLAGRHDEAIVRFRQALARDPDSYAAHYGVGRALDLAGRYAEARQHFTRALGLAPDANRDQAERMLAISCVFGGDVETAARHFTAVFDRRVAARNYGAAAEVANELGRVYLETGHLDEAEAWYRTGHEVDAREDDRPPARVDLADMRWAHARARIAARRGQADEARQAQAAVRALLDRDGNEEQRIQYPYLAGYVAFYLGDAAAAVTELERADQEDPFIRFLLARAHESLGHADIARQHYAAVLASTSHAVASALSQPVARAKLGGAQVAM